MADFPKVAPQLVRDTTPKFAELTDEVLFGDIWERPELSKRDRSLATVSALIVMGRDAQLRPHLQRALDNGVTADELREVITHLAFYAGWPTSMSATALLAEILDSDGA